MSSITSAGCLQVSSMVGYGDDKVTTLSIVLEIVLSSVPLALARAACSSVVEIEDSGRMEVETERVGKVEVEAEDVGKVEEDVSTTTAAG